MFARFAGRPGITLFACAMLLAAAIGGCGGQPTERSDMNVVLPEPGVNVSSKAAPSTASPGAGAGAEASPASGSPAAAAAAASSGRQAAGEHSRGRWSSTGRCLR